MRRRWALPEVPGASPAEASSPELPWGRPVVCWRSSRGSGHRRCVLDLLKSGRAIHQMLLNIAHSQLDLKIVGMVSGNLFQAEKYRLRVRPDR